MNRSTSLKAARILLTLLAVMTIVSPYIADWNVTHIYNPQWPPHAKYHNAQTMVLAVLLGLSALGFIWRLKKDSRSSLFTGLVFAGLYWVSQAFAFLFPGVAWTDPDLLKPGQSLADFPLQLKGDLVIFVVLTLSAWLIRHGTSNDDSLT